MPSRSIGLVALDPGACIDLAALASGMCCSILLALLHSQSTFCNCLPFLLRKAARTMSHGIDDMHEAKHCCMQFTCMQSLALRHFTRSSREPWQLFDIVVKSLSTSQT